MKKNLLDKESNERILSRAQRLQATTQALWGAMTATEMLLHCNKIHEQLLLPGVSSTQKTTIKQYAIRWLVLYILPRFPKHARAPKQMLTKGMVENTSFEQQKDRFIELVRRFPSHALPINHRHPYFGNLSSKQWGLAGWKHVDHHLRQFGV